LVTQLYQKCIMVSQRRRNLQNVGCTNQYKIRRSAQSARDLHGSFLCATMWCSWHSALSNLTLVSNGHRNGANLDLSLRQHLSRVANTSHWLPECRGRATRGGKSTQQQPRQWAGSKRQATGVQSETAAGGLRAVRNTAAKGHNGIISRAQAHPRSTISTRAHTRRHTPPATAATSAAVGIQQGGQRATAWQRQQRRRRPWRQRRPAPAQGRAQPACVGSTCRRGIAMVGCTLCCGGRKQQRQQQLPTRTLR